MTDGSELQLLVLWPKARFAERRILADVSREVEVVWKGELSFACDAACAYRRFYGPSLPDERHKVRRCGRGAFLVVVVRDPAPRYEWTSYDGCLPQSCNVRLLAMKRRYRTWTGSGHRVHGTLTKAEFARDVAMLTGHSAADWERGVPAGPFEPVLPDGWAAESTVEPFAEGALLPGPMPQVDHAHVFLENKYINDRFLEGTWRGRACVVKESAKAVWSIGNEYRMAAKLHAVAPSVVPMPFAWHYAGDGRSASVVAARVAGPSLTDLLARGLSREQADAFAADILALARALKETDIVHRDLFADNLLLDADGHLKAIDWQLAISRTWPREDPWVKRHWKFRYVVFGVNRELGLGVWNDFHALGKILARFPQTEAVRRAADELVRGAEGMTYSDPPGRFDRARLWFYGCSLRLQMLLRGRRHRKYPQLLNRWRTVRGRWGGADNTEEG